MVTAEQVAKLLLKAYSARVALERLRRDDQPEDDVQDRLALVSYSLERTTEYLLEAHGLAVLAEHLHAETLHVESPAS